MTGQTLRQTVEFLFTVIRDRGTKDELYFVCPQPGCADETGNRSVNLKTGKTNCWRCNKGGDFVRWARFLGYEVTDEGSNQAVPIEDIDFSANKDQTFVMPVPTNVRLPTGFTYCHLKPKHVYTELIGEMAERKGLTLEDFFRAKVGFTRLDPKWEPYAIFPVFDFGRVVYWQGRTYVDPLGESTKRFPNRQEVPNGAKFWIYGIDDLRTSRSEIVLVMESILNVLSMRRFFEAHGIANITPVCVFKHYLSKPQARKLLGVPTIKEICLLYDHDATRNSWEKSPTVSDRLHVTIAEMPPGPGGEKNDPNDDPEAAWAAFAARQTSDALSALAYQLSRTHAPPVSRRPLLSASPGNPLDNLGL